MTNWVVIRYIRAHRSWIAYAPSFDECETVLIGVEDSLREAADAVREWAKESPAPIQVIEELSAPVQMRSPDDVI